MGTYTRIYLKNKRFTEKVNTILKEKWGATYEVFNGVEYGFFHTEKMEKEDIRFMNEDKKGLKQVPHFKRPITKDIYRSLTKGWKEIGVYIVKISCPLDEELKGIEILKNFLKSNDAKNYINYKKSENLDRLINFFNQQ